MALIKALTNELSIFFFFFLISVGHKTDVVKSLNQTHPETIRMEPCFPPSSVFLLRPNDTRQTVLAALSGLPHLLCFISLHLPLYIFLCFVTLPGILQSEQAFIPVYSTQHPSSCPLCYDPSPIFFLL